MIAQDTSPATSERASEAGEPRVLRRRVARSAAGLALAALVSCAGDPHGLVITTDNRATVIRRVQRSKKLTPEEKRLFSAFIEHEDKLGQELRSSEGKTVARVIEEERAYEQGVAKAAATMDEAVQTLQKLFGTAAAQEGARKLSFKVLALRAEAEGSPFAGVDCDYLLENGFDKDLTRVEGRLVISDGEGRRIVEVPITETESLPAGESRNRTIHMNALLYPGLRQRLEANPNVNCKWFPGRFGFSDGTQLVATPAS